MEYLKSVIDSDVNHLVSSEEHRLTNYHGQSTPDEASAAIQQLVSEGQDKPEQTLLRRERESSEENFIEYFNSLYASFAHDPAVQSVLTSYREQSLMNEKITGLRNKKVAAMVSGGNIDVNRMTRIINSGLIKSWRKVYFDTIIPDQPGTLVKLLSLISESGANVLSITHERSQRGVEIGYTTVSFELETANEKHVEKLLATLKEKNYHVHLK